MRVGESVCTMVDLVVTVMIKFATYKSSSGNFSTRRVTCFRGGLRFVHRGGMLGKSSKRLLCGRIILNNSATLCHILNGRKRRARYPADRAPMAVVLGNSFVDNRGFRGRVAVALAPTNIMPKLKTVLLGGAVNRQIRTVVPTGLKCNCCSCEKVPTNSALVFACAVRGFS